jgi:hypothetical protein
MKSLFSIFKRRPCKKCGDTGVIDTGNNDLPCSCPAGDKAIFNTMDGQQTGAEIKKELRDPSWKAQQKAIIKEWERARGSHGS